MKKQKCWVERGISSKESILSDEEKANNLRILLVRRFGLKTIEKAYQNSAGVALALGESDQYILKLLRVMRDMWGQPKPSFDQRFVLTKDGTYRSVSSRPKRKKSNPLSLGKGDDVEVLKTRKSKSMTKRLEKEGIVVKNSFAMLEKISFGVLVVVPVFAIFFVLS